MKNYKQIEKLLENININACLKDEDIEDFDSLRDFLDENSFFNVEIIYHSKAIKYLQENDNSLTESLELAKDLDFTLENLNSETLASILASQNIKNDFEDLEDEITELLEA